MTIPAELAIETDARNAFYRDDGRRAWALVAFMVEHEEQVTGSDGITQRQNEDGEGRAVFRATELHNQLIPASAGFGGYYHPRASSNSRTQLVMR